MGIISDNGPGCGAVPEPGARSRSPAHSLGALGASGATWVEPPEARACSLSTPGASTLNHSWAGSKGVQPQRTGSQ